MFYIINVSTKLEYDVKTLDILRKFPFTLINVGAFQILCVTLNIAH